MTTAVSSGRPALQASAKIRHGLVQHLAKSVGVLPRNRVSPGRQDHGGAEWDRWLVGDVLVGYLAETPRARQTDRAIDPSRVFDGRGCKNLLDADSEFFARGDGRQRRRAAIRSQGWCWCSTTRRVASIASYTALPTPWSGARSSGSTIAAALNEEIDEMQSIEVRKPVDVPRLAGVHFQ